MASKKHCVRQYEKFGRMVNVKAAVDRVKGDRLPPPEKCHYCQGEVALVSNADFYGGREYGWPLAYSCTCCGARVGCHPGTDIPLGSLADKATMKARQEAHAAFDALWKERSNWHRTQAYQALAKAMGMRTAHISWMDVTQCRRVVDLCQSGALFV